MLGRATLLLCAGALLCALPLHAQSSPSSWAVEPGTGVDNGVDPLHFRHRVELEERVFEADERLLERGYTTILRADWAVTRRDIFRLILPYTHLDFEEDQTGDFGDTRLQFLRKVDRRSPKHYIDAVGFGLELVLPTGDLEDRTGRAQWAVAPLVMFSAYPGHGVGIFPSFRLTKSLSHDEPEAPGVTVLSASSMFSWNHPRWWIAAEPEMVVDFDGPDETSYALRFQAGLQLSRRFAVLAGVGKTLGGSRELFDEEALVALRFLP